MTPACGVTQRDASRPTNRACLGAFLSLFLTETDFGAARQAIESAVQNGVAVKMDLAPIRRFDEAAVLLGQEFRHAAVAGHVGLLVIGRNEGYLPDPRAAQEATIAGFMTTRAESLDRKEKFLASRHQKG